RLLYGVGKINERQFRFGNFLSFFNLFLCPCSSFHPIVDCRLVYSAKRRRCFDVVSQRNEFAQFLLQLRCKFCWSAFGELLFFHDAPPFQCIDCSDIVSTSTDSRHKFLRWDLPSSNTCILPDRSNCGSGYTIVPFCLLCECRQRIPEIPPQDRASTIE